MHPFIESASRRTKQLWLLCLIVLTFAFAGYHAYVLKNGDPFKVTNPDDPRFDPLHYEGADYSENFQMWTRAAKKALPQGTSIDKIRIIMKNNDKCFSEMRRKEYPGMLFYACNSSLKYPKGTAVMFYLGKEDTLIDYFGSGVRGIYSGKFPEEIMKEIANEQR